MTRNDLEYKIMTIALYGGWEALARKKNDSKEQKKWRENRQKIAKEILVSFAKRCK